MPTPSDSNHLVYQVVNIDRSDRWLLQRRLQELMIKSWCSDDGSLWVEVKHSNAAILVHSTVKQFLSPRQELLDWLERCWQNQVY